MREIKFRAWDKEEKKMYYPEFNSDVLSALYGTETVKGKGNVVMLQFTGLKDKNGKEIYEGDIIKNKFDEITDVRWTDSLDWWPCSNEIYGNSNWDDKDYFEIIGNIYENPELK